MTRPLPAGRRPREERRAGAAETIRFRRADPADAARLAAFAARLFHETYDAFNPPEDMAAYVGEHFVPERIDAELRDPAVTVLLGETGGALAAYAHLRAGPAPAGVAGRAPLEIARFYVDSPWQGRGVAGEMMKAVLAGAGEAGHDALWLGVWRENPRAIRFYRRHGFEVVGTRDFRLGTDVQSDFVMARPTGPG